MTPSEPEHPPARPAESPIGALYVKAQKAAEEKKSGLHEETAGCGCLVRVSVFTPGGHGAHFDRCTDHVLVRGRKR